MTILVDGLTDYGEIARAKGLRWTEWCHMVSDVGEDELHEFAARLGLKRAWFQGRHNGASAAHYDLIASKRSKAVALGAVEVSSRELVQRNYDGLTQRRNRGELPCPT